MLLSRPPRAVSRSCTVEDVPQWGHGVATRTELSARPASDAAEDAVGFGSPEVCDTPFSLSAVPTKPCTARDGTRSPPRNRRYNQKLWIGNVKKAAYPFA